jgi:hypothetical protein
LVAGLILLLDQRPWVAGLWAIAGALTGFFGFNALRPLSLPMLEWYHHWNEDEERLRLMDSLTCEGKTDSEEFERCLAEEAFAAYLAVPPFVGLFHGILLGAIGGALCGIDRDAGISASAGAALGVLVGPVLVAFVAGVAMASVVPLAPPLSWRERLARRGLLVVSPLLIVPAAWYCLRMVVHQRR